MVHLIALRQLSGDYGKIAPSQDFWAEDEQALELESRGLVRRYPDRKAIAAAPENKMLHPVENKAAEHLKALARKRN